MTRIENITPKSGIKVKWKGMVDLDELYKAMKIWLEEKEFFDENKSEVRYVERRFPGFKHIEINWKTKKTENIYITHHIDVNFLLLAVSETEVQLSSGQKRKLHKGDFEIIIMSYLELGDKAGGKEWEAMGPMEKFYYNIIMRRRIDTHMTDLYDKTMKFQSMIKEFFENT